MNHASHCIWRFASKICLKSPITTRHVASYISTYTHKVFFNITTSIDRRYIAYEMSNWASFLLLLLSVSPSSYNPNSTLFNLFSKLIVDIHWICCILRLIVLLDKSSFPKDSPTTIFTTSAPADRISSLWYGASNISRFCKHYIFLLP